MKKIGILFLLFLSIAYFLMSDRQSEVPKKKIASTTSHEENNQPGALPQKSTEQMEIRSKSEESETKNLQGTQSPLHAKAKIESSKKPNEENFLTYEIDDGFAVIHGDVIIGEVSRDQILKSLSGPVREPSLRIWPTNEIAFYIQPNLRNPERVNEAIAYFSGTNVQFVPYVNQEDAIVFENGNGACKSYLGYIGGKQPIYLSEACSAQAIAHEIMHALGFLHEQNRTDRDDYIDIVWSNIDPKANLNFEKFSRSMMQVSGLAKFDFESIMIYPQTMFSVNGQATMKSKIEGQVVAPRQGLSLKDAERLNKVY